MSRFGPQNFTAEARVILAPLVIEGFYTDREYWCFKGLTAEVAAHLLTQLPARFREERHNDGPAFGSLVKVATAYEGILLEGYVVGPPRDDERVTLTGIWIPASLVWYSRVSQAPNHQMFDVLQMVSRVLDELDAAIPPDELDQCNFCGKAFWRAWWD